MAVGPGSEPHTMSHSLRALLPGPRARLGASTFRRAYAVQTPGSPRFQVFNRHTKWMQKERAGSDPEGSRVADYLKDEVAIRLCERLLVS